MAKLTLSDLSNLSNESSAVATVNSNNTAIETALENTLSRDGTSPNQMNADLDMNSNQILNLPEPTVDADPVRLGDLENYVPRWFVQRTEPATDEPENSFWVDSDDPYYSLYQLIGGVWTDTDVNLDPSGTGGGSGTVVGPLSSTDNAVVRFDSTTGAIIQNSVVTIADTTGTMTTSGAGDLGSTSAPWGSLFLGSGKKIDFNNGDVTVTHSSNTLAFAGASSGYSFDASVTGTSFIPSSSTIPSNGLYLPAANTLGWAINSAAEVQLTSSAFSPAVSDGNALGTTSLMWSDLFLASGGVINWDNGNTTITQASGGLATNGYLRVGFASAPANTTAGDLTATRVFVGNEAVVTFAGSNVPSIQVNGITSATASIGLSRWVASIASANVYLAKSRGATVGTRGIVAADDRLGSLFFLGDDGTAFLESAIFRVSVDGTPGTNDMPTRFEFHTTADGASSPTGRWIIDSTGALKPYTSDGASIGTTANMVSDAFFASGAVLNFNAGNYTLTHSSGLLTASGNLAISGTTASTAYNNGALVVSGGVGVAGAMWVNGRTYLGGLSSGDTIGEVQCASPLIITHASFASFILKHTGGGSDAKYWDFGVGTNMFQIRALNDAFNAAASAMEFNRSGYTITNCKIPIVYSDTTASAANVFVDTDGRLKRSTSSLAYKENVEDYSRGLADVMKIRPVFFSPKGSAERFGGFIAEEIFDAGLTEFVALRDGKPDALHYGHMTALAIKGIQEHKSETDRMAEEIRQLKDLVKNLTGKIIEHG